MKIAPDAAALYEKGELIVKVKEPIAGDLAHLRRDHLLFCYLHLAAEPALTRRLLEIGLTGVAFETVELPNGDLPLLAPMSVIAGKHRRCRSARTCCTSRMGGKGKLLGGLPSTERGKVVVFGAGKAGGTAAALAAAGGANVIVFEMRQDRMDEMMRLGNNVTALYPYHDVVAREVAAADLVIGAVLVTGARAPHVMTREMLAGMEPGSVVVDIAIDQGGCFETSRPTTWKEPTYVEGGRDPFLRDQHARRGAADLLAGDLRGDPALGQPPGQRRRLAQRPVAGQGHQRRCRQDRASGAAWHGPLTYYQRPMGIS